MPIVQCEICNKDFEKSSTRIKITNRHFCTKACLYASRHRPSETKTCDYCGKVFEVPYSLRTRKYCCNPCAHLARARDAKMELTCSVCNKSFERRRVLTSPDQNYCSNKCANRGKDQKVERTCPTCNKVFAIPPCQVKDVNYCSHKCTGKARQQRIARVCKACGGEFEVTASDLNFPGGGTFCSQSCTCSYTVAHSRQKRTNIEIAIDELLSSMNVGHTSQVHMGKFVCDFVIKSCRLVIEADGTYWHSNPKQQEKDTLKDAWLVARSYKVLRLDEAEILNDIDGCKQKILEAMQRKGTHAQLTLLP